MLFVISVVNKQYKIKEINSLGGEISLLYQVFYYIRSLYTVEPLYNEVLGTMKITLLYQVSYYIGLKKQKYKELGPAKLPRYKRILLYPTSL